MAWQSEVRAWTLAAAGVFALSGVGYRAWFFPDVSGVVSHIDSATGVWADASKQQVKSVAAIENDLRAEMWHLDRSLLAVDTTLKTAQGTLAEGTEAVGVVKEQLKGVGPLLASAQQTTDAIPATLQAAQGTLTAAQGAISEGDGAVRDFRSYMAQYNPEIASTLGNVQQLTGSAAGITSDVQKVSDKLTADYLRKVPWYQKPLKYFGDFWDISAAVARHTP